MFALSVIAISVGLLSIVLIFWLGSSLYSLAIGAPALPSRYIIIKKALELAHLEHGETLLDLGAGSGRVLRIAEKYFGAKAVGVEGSPFYYLIGKLKTLGVPNARFLFGRIESVDFSKADVIYCYLWPSIMPLIEKRIQRTKPGTRLVTVSFPLPHTKPDVILSYGQKIYLYRR